MIVNCNQSITLDTEIRKLKPAQIFKLSMLLNISDSWKKLMAIVPKDDSGRHKFDIEHFCLIEEASRQQKRGCGEIFLDEWSTMGKQRPTLQNLLDLLTKADLYRAADYIAIDVLNWKEGPARPNSGPAAHIDMSKVLLESSEEVETSSSISEEIYVEHSYANKVGNPVECLQPENICEENQVSYQIPAFLNDITLSSFNAMPMNEKSAEMNSTSSESDNSESTIESSSESSEIAIAKDSANLPLCLREINFSSDLNESSNMVIPRLIQELTISQ